MSAPSHFLPTKIKSLRGEQSFVGGPLGARNPTRELLREAGITFGSDIRVAQIISLGCGIPQILTLDELTGKAGLGQQLEDMAADCQMVANDLSARFFNVDAYLRLNVENGVGGTEFDDWSVLGSIESNTSVYIGNVTVTNAVDASLHRVRNQVGTTTLGRLSKHIEVDSRPQTDFICRPVE
jgi:hypothetical protein